VTGSGAQPCSRCLVPGFSEHEGSNRRGRGPLRPAQLRSCAAVHPGSVPPALPGWIFLISAISKAEPRFVRASRDAPLVHAQLCTPDCFHTPAALPTRNPPDPRATPWRLRRHGPAPRLVAASLSREAREMRHQGPRSERGQSTREHRDWLQMICRAAGPGSGVPAVLESLGFV
jgi:hypothetical protein